MNDLIPLKFRLLAAGLYLIGSIPIVLILLFVLILTMGGSILTTIFNLLVGVYIILVIVSAISWITTSEVHPFISKSRKIAINYALNNLVAIFLCAIFCVFVFMTTCGIGNQDPTPLLLSLLLFAGVMMMYLINSIVTAIFALRGYCFKSRLIYAFIRDE
jgi:hypothetical protein